ncbi:MAG: hypothetical protein JWN34_1596, partial [Bryobacterales bacterium]|nr:hypothetical protein [Bryobacterales bacterium]
MVGRTWTAALYLLAFSLPSLLEAGTQGPDAGGYSATDTAVFNFVE